MEILHPRRVLVLSPSGIDTRPILNSLLSKSSADDSKSTVPSRSPSSASTELIHHIKTPYYTAKIPIWQDVISSPEGWAEEWKDSRGASEVVSAVAAWIVVFEGPRDQAGLSAIKTLLKQVSKTISHHSDNNSYSYSESTTDALLLAISLPQRQLPALDITEQHWDDICQDSGGWEYIDSEGKGKNEFGELRGLARMCEALEAAEWDGRVSGDDESYGNGQEDDLDTLLHDIEEHDLSSSDTEQRRLFSGVDGDLELQAELQQMVEAREHGMQVPILKPKDVNAPMTFAGDEKGDEQGEDDVEDLQRMLLKLQAARDLGTDLPQAERRKLAAKAVAEVMKI